MFWCFLVSICCDTVENRVFIQDNSNFTGSWEYSGVSMMDDENTFILLPGNSTKSGGAYSTQALKFHNFSAEFLVEFTPRQQITNLGIWITKNYHMEPRVFGGPLSFSGIGILMQYNGTTLATELRKNDERGKFVTYHFFPTSVVKLQKPQAKVRIQFSNNTITVFINGQKEIEDVPLQDIYKYYLSITGRNVKNASLVSVLSGYFSSDPEDDFKPTTKSVISLHTNEKEETEAARKEREEFQNKQRQEKQKDLQAFAKMPHNYRANDVLDEVYTFSLYTDVITKDKDIKKLIFNEIVPFADAWQRRSINIVKNTKNLRENLTVVLNETYTSLDQVRNEVDIQLGKLKRKLQSIESDLFFGINDGYELQNELKVHEQEGTKGLGKILLLLGITEVNVLVTFFVIIFIRNRCNSN